MDAAECPECERPRELCDCDEFVKPTDAEKIQALDSVRVLAQEIAQRMRSTEAGDEYVYTGGLAVGHAADGTLGEGDGTGRRPPSTASIKPVE